MDVLLSPNPPLFPHQHDTQRLSPSRTAPPYHNMGSASRKRKADDDGDEMSVSPTNSPAHQARQLARPAKRARGVHEGGRSLTLPRLLETLDASQLREVLQAVCDHNPAIGHEIATNAPRPTAESALRVLDEYQQKFTAALPYGHTPSDYSYHRVRQPLLALCDAISDFTPQFLPPAASQNSISFQFLDGATKIIHSLPDWNSQSYRHHKEGAYDDIAKAWALVVQEAAKRGGGFTLHSDRWDQVIIAHNQQSGGRLNVAVNALNSNVGWIAGHPPSPSRTGHGGPSDTNSILNQIVNGNFGSPVQVGPW